MTCMIFLFCQWLVALVHGGIRTCNQWWQEVKPLGHNWYSYWVICIYEYKRADSCIPCMHENRSRSAVHPSVCPSVRPKILSSQLLWNYWSNYHVTWYVDRTSYVVMHFGRKFWSPHFFGSFVPWNLENTHKWSCHRNSSETTHPIFMKLGM